MRNFEISTTSWCMIFAVQILLVFRKVGSSNTVSSIKYGLLDEASKKRLFDEFMKNNHRDYKDKEYDSRFYVFTNKLNLIDSRNQMEIANGGTAVHGINKFTDLTMEEGENLLLGTSIILNISDSILKEYKLEGSANIGKTTFINWAGKYTTVIKDQQYCGSCAAFVAVEQVETDAIRLQGWTKENTLSTQQLVDCAPGSQGCLGGNIFDIYKYIKSAGLELDADYPYTGEAGNCKFKTDNSKVKVESFVFFNYNNPSKYSTVELEMANYVLSTGPLSIHIDGTAWLTYNSGILASCTNNINHVAQIVGIDTVKKYWIVRNSWGTSWGELGYIRLQYMTNQCSLASYPSYVITEVLN